MYDIFFSLLDSIFKNNIKILNLESNANRQIISNCELRVYILFVWMLLFFVVVVVFTTLNGQLLIRRKDEHYQIYGNCWLYCRLQINVIRIILKYIYI